MEPDKKTILQEIESLHQEIEDLRKYVDTLEAWVTWTNTFVKELMDVVGIPPYHQTHQTRDKPGAE